MTFVHNYITRKPREIAMHLLLCSHSKTTVYNPHRQVKIGAAVPPLRFECKKSAARTLLSLHTTFNMSHRHGIERSKNHTLSISLAGTSKSKCGCQVRSLCQVTWDFFFQTQDTGKICSAIDAIVNENITTQCQVVCCCNDATWQKTKPAKTSATASHVWGSVRRLQQQQRLMNFLHK